MALFLSACATLGVSSPGTARTLAGPDSELRGSAVEASALAQHGASLFDEGRFDEAVAEYRKAYELDAQAIFLFHIARSYQRLARDEQALFFYRRFLSAPGPAAERDEAERQRALLESRLRTEDESAPVPTAAATPPALDMAVVDAPRGHDDEPPHRLWRSPLVWAAVGTAVLAGAILVVLATQGDGDGVPSTDLGHARLF